MSPSQNSNVFADRFIKSLLKCLLWFLLHFKQLKINWLSFIFMCSRQDLQSLHLLLWNPSERLSTRLDNKMDINLKLSMNFILYVTASSFSSSFLIGTESYTYFVFFPKHSNCPSNSSTSSLIRKMIVIFRTIMKYYRNFFWCFVS